MSVCTCLCVCVCMHTHSENACVCVCGCVRALFSMAAFIFVGFFFLSHSYTQSLLAELPGVTD